MVGRNIRLGDVLRARVTHVEDFGVYVDVAPGISGVIRRADLAPYLVKRPEEEVWIEDIVEGVVVEIDNAKRLIRLNVSERIRLSHIVAKVLHHWDSESRSSEPDFVNTEENESGYKWSLNPKELENKAPILIVEDLIRLADDIAEWLHFSGWRAEVAYDSTQAKQLVTDNTYTALIVDINLKADNGLEVLKAIPNDRARPAIIVMSIPNNIAAHAQEITDAHVLDVLEKPFELARLDELLSHVVLDEILPHWTYNFDGKTNTDGVLKVQFELESLDQPIAKRLKNTLERLHNRLQAQRSVLFVRNPASRQIEIAEIIGSERPAPYLLYDLDRSPVNDVLERSDEIFDNNVKARTTKYAYLLQVFDFNSCIGLPIYVQNEVTHALFFFSEDVSHFKPTMSPVAIAGALLFSSLFEMYWVEQRMQRLSTAFTKGELAERLLHEVRNGMQAIQASVDILKRNRSIDDLPARLNRISDGLSSLVEAVKSFESSKGLLSLSKVDMGEAIHGALNLVQYLADAELVKIDRRIASDLPIIRTSGVAVQQILINLVLNSVQHIVLLRKKDDERIGLIEITAYVENETIYVNVRDNGPGVHRLLWEKILSAGFTTRENGSGLGLSIARSFLAALNGKIYIKESIMLVGTSFLVEIPTNSGQG